MPGIRVTGIDCHIGSQLTTVEPFLDAIDRLLLMTDVLAAEALPFPISIWVAAWG